jgi:hypothetical protein
MAEPIMNDKPECDAIAATSAVFSYVYDEARLGVKALRPEQSRLLVTAEDGREFLFILPVKAIS